MVNLVLLFWTLLCPNPKHTPANHGKCPLIHVDYSTLDEDTGGETGNFPPKPPGPPPPPPPGPIGG